jgi:hypothetical protein
MNDVTVLAGENKSCFVFGVYRYGRENKRLSVADKDLQRLWKRHDDWVRGFDIL